MAARAAAPVAPLVSPRPAVVVVTYRSGDVIGPCLQRLLASDVEPEVVVIDNASGDGSADVAARHDAVTVIRNRDNRGFAAAVVQGVAATRGDPVVLLNPDTEVEPDCLRRLAEALEDTDVAIAGCKVLDTDGRTIQHAGGMMGPNALTDHVGRGEVDRGQYDEVSDVPYVTGAALAIRRRIWEVLGGLDVGYWPAYFEECELCWRARAAGYRVIVEPRAVLRHHEAASTRGQREALPETFYRAYHRNRLRFVLRNFPLTQLLGGFLPAELRWMLAGHHRGQGKALWRAYGAALRELPATLRHRLRGPTPPPCGASS
jgi:GT2 family glycosyltransferase